MSGVVAFLNNREKAVVVWLVIALLYCLKKASTRKPLLSMLKTVFKTFTSKQVGPLFLIFTLYIVILISLGYKTKLWNFDLLKDTIIWFMGTALILFMNSPDASRKEHFFKKEIAKNLKFALVLVFIINLYVFNFYIELLFVPFVTFVIIMLAFSESKAEFALVKKMMQMILIIVAFILIIHAFTSLIKGFHDFDTLQTLRDLLLAPVLTIAILPLVYLLAVYSTYELLFVQLRHRKKDDKHIVHYAMREIIKACHLRLSRVVKFSKEHYPAVTYIDSKSDVDSLVKKYKGVGN